MIYNKKLCLFVAGCCLFGSAVYAQKKNFTMAEATNGMATTLALQSIKQPAWQPGSHAL